jgi:hypothetical protein
MGQKIPPLLSKREVIEVHEHTARDGEERDELRHSRKSRKREVGGRWASKKDSNPATNGQKNDIRVESPHGGKQ